MYRRTYDAWGYSPLDRDKQGKRVFAATCLVAGNGAGRAGDDAARATTA